MSALSLVKVGMSVVSVGGMAPSSAADARGMLLSEQGQVALVLRRRSLVPGRGWARYKRRESSTRRTAAQREFLWRVFNSRPKMSHFVAATAMRTYERWGFKFLPRQWLAAAQIKS